MDLSPRRFAYRPLPMSLMIDRRKSMSRALARDLRDYFVSAPGYCSRMNWTCLLRSSRCFWLETRQ
jgi:hypothetical protein